MSFDVSYTDDGSRYRCAQGHEQAGQHVIIIRGAQAHVTAPVCLTCVIDGMGKQYAMQPVGATAESEPEPAPPASVPAPVEPEPPAREHHVHHKASRR